MQGVSIPEPFIKACFSCLNLGSCVCDSIHNSALRANKPHMFRFSPYLSSHDKVERSILQEICDRIHGNIYTVAEGGMCLFIFVFFNSTRLPTQRRHSVKVS